jgi:hypothetical protein
VLLEQGNLGQAEARYRTARTLLRSVRGERHPEAIAASTGLGSVFLAQGKYAEAEPLFREALAYWDGAGPDDWQRFHVRGLLGGALGGRKQFAGAEPLLVAGYEGMKQRAGKIPPQDKDRLPEAAERLVRFAASAGKPADAAKWRKELYAGAEPLPAPRVVVE